MHHVVLERWSRQAGPLHRRDPRAKVLVLIVFLIVLATAHRHFLELSAGLAILLCAAILAARLPLPAALSRAGVVLPFSLAFAGVCWLTGDPARGLQLLIKSYLSAVAALLLVSTTPLPTLFRGLESLGAPRFLLMVAQFLYRYLFVISEEAQHMAKAALSRGATTGGMVAHATRFKAAAGALAVLFARSYGRAGDVHNAMLSRGFQGRFQTVSTLHLHPADVVLAVAGCAGPAVLRLALEKLA